MCCRRLIPTVVFCLIAAMAFAASAWAQAPFYKGSTTTVYGSVVNNTGDLGADNPYRTWSLTGPSTNATTSAPAGWTVVLAASNGLKITAPSTALAGSYTASFASSRSFYQGEYTYSGPKVTFQIVDAPNTLPPSMNVAFPWQGSVAGVNTGNGNKTTTLPIAGWTQRGGMGISCALFHNSQIASPVSTYGHKWVPSYYTYLSNTGGDPILHWDNGLSYTFKKIGSTYTPPYGILDKLVSGGGATFTLTTTDNTKYAFVFVSGTSAYLSSITDEDGNMLSIAHNADTTLQSLSDATGRTLTYAYSGGYLSSITDPLSRVWNFAYGGPAGAGNLWTATLPLISGPTSYLTYRIGFSYDTAFNITGQQSAGGNTATFNSDSTGHLNWAKDPLGSQTSFSYGNGANTDTTIITDPNGHTVSHTYAFSRLVSIKDALGLSEGYSYDYNNILASKTDKNFYAWYYASHFSATQAPNPDGTLPSTELDAMGNYSKSSYDPTSNKLMNSTDPIGNVTSYMYSSDGKNDLTSTSIVGTGTAPFQATSHLGSYVGGQPTTMTDPLGHSSSVAFDPDGQAISATDAGANAGAVTTKSLPNALGWTIAAADGLNHITATVYDAWGRGIVVIMPDSTSYPLYRLRYGGVRDLLTTSFSEAQGDEAASGHGLIPSVIGCTFPLGTEVPSLVRLYRYKATGSSSDRLYSTSATVPGGYAADGNAGYVLTAATTNWQALYQAYNGTTHIYTADVNEYNALVSPWTKQGIIAYVLKQTASSSTVQTTYDPDGNVKTVTDANAHTITNLYDADDRLTQTTNGRGDIVKYTYDGPSGYGSLDASGNTQYGLLSAKTDGNGHITTYIYSARNEPLATYYPDSTSESVTYDNNGNTFTRTKPDGKVIHYTYDADNRLTKITYPLLPAVSFYYDIDSRCTSMTDSTGMTNWDYTYDGVHMTAQGTPLGGSTAYVYYAFDADGHRTGMQLAGTGTWTYGYYNNSLPSTLQTPFGENTSWQYDGANRLLQENQGNGAYHTFAYDAASELTDIGDYYYGGMLDRYLHYGYDPAGNVHTRQEGTFSSGGYDLTTTYTYDGNDQLTNEAGTGSPAYSRGYTYDHNANRLTQTLNGGAYQTFTYDAHDKMLSGTDGNETPSFDANGNERGTTINGGSWVDVYDDEDRLTSVTPPGSGTDTFTYNGLGLRVGKVDSTGTYSYVCDGTTPGSPILSDGHAVYTPGLSERRNGSSLFYNSDDLGNLWSAEDGTGQAEAGVYLFTSFGAPLSTGSGAASASPLKYGGANGCLTDADTGLVLMGHRYYDSRTGRFLNQDPIGDGDNWYAYTGNSPTNEVDPTGLVIAGGGLFQDPSQAGVAYDPSGNVSYQDEQDNPGEYNVYAKGADGNYTYAGSRWEGATAFDQMNSSMSAGAPGGGMIGGKAYGPNHHYYPTRTKAMNAARNAGQGKPIEDVHDKNPRTLPHFHSTDKAGNKKSPSNHFYYPRRGGQGRPKKYDMKSGGGRGGEVGGAIYGGGGPVVIDTQDGPIEVEPGEELPRE